MIRKAVAGLAALGLIGGAGSVAWHNGSATVKIKDKNGVVHSTVIKGGGKNYSCPAGESDKLNPLVQEAGRIKITLQGVDQYAEPDRYDQLVNAYNAEVDQYNTTLRSDCN